MIGVDPGGTYTGVVARASLRAGTGPLYAAVVTRADGVELVDYLLEVLDTIVKARSLDSGPQAGEIAVEDVQPPTGWKAGERAPIDPEGLLNAARILGGIECRWPNRHLVAPGGHGSHPLALYPAQLIGAREKVGTGYRRHARSAWDVAGVALLGRPDPTKADPGRVAPAPPEHDQRTTP